VSQVGNLQPDRWPTASRRNGRLTVRATAGQDSGITFSNRRRLSTPDDLSYAARDMPATNENMRENQIPLVVDMDGTLIRTDMTWESLVCLLRRNPLLALVSLLWLLRGRAFYKQQLAARVQVDAATLPYHEPFQAWLKEQKRAGRKLVLATASDIEMARPVAQHVGLFDEILASDGSTNLRGAAKRRKLVELYGDHGFDYAGNSSVDLGVWPQAHGAIVVNASERLTRRAAKVTQVLEVF
jgi:phosphoserine phosphatase